MESYIYESAFIQKDITWFPSKKLYIAKPEELEIDSDEYGTKKSNLHMSIV